MYSLRNMYQKVEILTNNSARDGVMTTMFSSAEMKHYDYIDTVRFSSPTCEQLGIPGDDQQQQHSGSTIENTSVTIDGMRYETINKVKADPFSPYSMIPLPSPFGSVFDPSCIRRRNERERDRVRCVNDGYLKLKEHLPLDNKEKRISKVETLRGAIQYIKHLKSILESSKNESIIHIPDTNAIHNTVKAECYKNSQCNKENDKVDNPSRRCTSGMSTDEMQSFPVDESSGTRTRGRYNTLRPQKTMRTH